MTANAEMVRHDDDRTGQRATGFPLENADHAMGLELQIVELVEQQTRARVQHRDRDAEQFDDELAQLRSELAATAEVGDPGTVGLSLPS
jgi:hypothetical protein